MGAVLILASKLLLVTAMVRMSGIVTLTARRVGLLLAVGGEFGFALLAIALDSSVIDERLDQIALTTVFFSMIGGSVLIRFNQVIATRLGAARHGEPIADTNFSLGEPI